jgi:hypothetical protein
MSPWYFNCAIFKAVGRTAAGVLFDVGRKWRRSLLTRYYQRNFWRFGWLSPRHTFLVAITEVTTLLDIFYICWFACVWRNTRFLDHTQRRITVSRTPLDEWLARRRDLYLTTHTKLTTDKHPFHRWDSNPQSQQVSGRRPEPWTARPLATAHFIYLPSSY